MQDWAADGSAELVAFQGIANLNQRRGGRRLGVAEVVGCIQVSVADVLEEIAVPLVGSGLGDYVDDAAGVLAVLCAVVAGLDAELLERVRHGEGRADVGIFVDVIAAVEQVVGLIGTGAVSRDGEDAREGLLIPLIGALVGSPDYAWCKQCQSGRIAPVEAVAHSRRCC